MTDKAAENRAFTDSTVQCSRCHATREVKFATCLRLGWPTCHGYTMTLVSTRADVGAATVDAIRSQGSLR